MIEKFCGVCTDAMNTLLDAYQMKNWNMTWEEFLEQFTCEMLDTVKKWKKEYI